MLKLILTLIFCSLLHYVVGQSFSGTSVAMNNNSALPIGSISFFKDRVVIPTYFRKARYRGQLPYNYWGITFFRYNLNTDTTGRFATSAPGEHWCTLVKGDSLYGFSKSEETEDTLNYPGISIVVLDTNMVECRKRVVSFNTGRLYPLGVKLHPNGDFYVYGESEPGVVYTNTTGDWFLARISKNLIPRWIRRYNPRATYPWGVDAEWVSENRIRITGGADTRVCTTMVDTNGMLVDSFATVFTHRAGVAALRSFTYELPGSKDLIISSSENGVAVSTSAYVQRQTANRQILWRTTLSSNVWYRPVLLSDTSLLIATDDDRSSFLTKIGPNGNMIFNVEIDKLFTPHRRGYESRLALYDDTTAYLYTENFDTTVVPNTRNAVLLRITNFGSRWGAITSQSGPRHNSPTITVVPNPSAGDIWLKGIVAPTSVDVYDARGSKVSSLIAMPNEQLPLGSLSAGVYTLVSSGKRLRFVKQ